MVKNDPLNHFLLEKYFVRKVLSGRRDLNSGPRGPEPRALAGLSHAPMRRDYNLAEEVWQGK